MYAPPLKYTGHIIYIFVVGVQLVAYLKVHGHVLTSVPATSDSVCPYWEELL